MYAIVDIAGQQFKVEKDQKIFVNRLDGEAGSNMFFDKVLLIDNGKNIIIGNPLISDALISVKILSHLKGDKVIVFKKKRRKAYQIRKGHRQLLSEIQISEILEKGGAKFIKETAAKKPAKETTPKGKKDKSEKVTAPVEVQKVVSPVTEKEEKVTRKPAQKAKPVAEKKTSASKTGKSKPADSVKDKAPSAAKSSKSKSKPAQKASSKKTDKPSKK
jgi:large subunit ribosomal protein L21